MIQNIHIYPLLRFDLEKQMHAAIPKGLRWSCRNFLGKTKTYRVRLKRCRSTLQKLWPSLKIDYWCLKEKSREKYLEL